jgi:hypothetical protein
MDLDAVFAAARKRIHEFINRSVAQRLRRLREQQNDQPKQPRNP